MSKANKDTQNTEQQPEKVITKYDRKVQKRKEEKEKERRDKLIGRIVGIGLVVALACLVASFPIRSWLTVNGSYVRVDGKDITKVEFDYNYNIVSNNYIAENYYTFYYYFGIDLTGDLTKQMYSETLTWKDFFDQTAVENIARNKGLVNAAQAEGFTYDTTEEYNDYMEALKEAAKESGSSVGEYIKNLYGPYATEARVKPFVEEGMYANAYVALIEERMAPSQDDIQAHYDSNKASYDSVDYYIYTVDAELPTEPTELADPVEPAEGSTGDGASGTNNEGGETTEGAEQEVYQPSEAEIAAAMEVAKEEADRAVRAIKVNGELKSNLRQAAVTPYLLRDWLFAEERKTGDTTVIEDNTNHRYYVLEFENRYLDQTLTADVRVAMTAQDNGQEILDEWKNGAATEESFAEICDKYNDPQVTTLEGGLAVGVAPSELSEKVREWVTDSARVAGDTAVITPEEEGYTYVLYYVAPNEAEWILSIRGTLLEERVMNYLEEVIAGVKVDDPKGNLAFLKVEEEDNSGDEASPAPEGEGTPVPEGEAEPTPEPVG
jgi:hypothetical protein